MTLSKRKVHLGHNIFPKPTKRWTILSKNVSSFKIERVSFLLIIIISSSTFDKESYEITLDRTSKFNETLASHSSIFNGINQLILANDYIAGSRKSRFQCNMRYLSQWFPFNAFAISLEFMIYDLRFIETQSAHGLSQDESKPFRWQVQLQLSSPFFYFDPTKEF